MVLDHVYNKPDSFNPPIKNYIVVDGINDNMIKSVANPLSPFSCQSDAGYESSSSPHSFNYDHNETIDSDINLEELFPDLV